MSAYLQKLKAETEFKTVVTFHKSLTIFFKKVHLRKCTKFLWIAWIFMTREENPFQFVSPFL